MYQYKAKLIRVIDGDTIDAMIALGFNTWVKKRIRLAEMDAYELRTRNKEEKKKGIAARDRLQQLLAQNDNEFSLVSCGVGKYGRCIGKIYIVKQYVRGDKYHGKSINEAMIKEGHAKRI